MKALEKNLEMNIQLETIRSLIDRLQSEIKDLEARVYTDDLTGLLRRNAFSDKASALLGSASSTRKNVGFLMIDLDHFKKINDTLGHSGGDEVLKKVSRFLKQFQLPNSIVGRFGGEEFVLAMQGSEREIDATAEMIRRGVEAMGCTVSIGVAHTAQQGFDESDLLKSADEALYAAKNSGRNQVKRAA
jgi:diguanylate cyclase (GGDEF)-like protein